MRSLRILQVVSSLNHGGVETWLVNLLDHFDSNVRFDFLVHVPGRFAYSDRAEQHGCRVLYCDRPSNPLSYAKNFRKLLSENGPYDVIHSHIHYFGGYPLSLARQAGVGSRICHSHLDTREVDGHAKPLRRGYLALTKQLVDWSATRRIAVSQGAGESLFKREFSLFPCAIDPKPFLVDRSAVALRQKYNIPESAFVIGHVGRFDEQKNHVFLLKIALEFLRSNRDFAVVFVGSGQLFDRIKHLSTLIDGVRDRVIFTGPSNEVPAMMLGLFDLFLFPSLYEGLPLALLEAQAAGLPCVISDTITPETDVIPELVCRVPITSPPSEWAAQIAKMKYERRPSQILDPRFAPYLIESSAHRLQAIYGNSKPAGSYHRPNT